MIIRDETPDDVAAIRDVNVEAFKDHPISQQTEHLIVEALRDDGALEISLVAVTDGDVVGHVAFSACRVGETAAGWRLLGPIAVRPSCQREGIGSCLVEAGLARLRERGAAGCALVGDPAFYGRFGFRHYPGLTCHGVPDEYVLALPFHGETPAGEVEHHRAFLVS